MLVPSGLSPHTRSLLLKHQLQILAKMAMLSRANTVSVQAAKATKATKKGGATKVCFPGGYLYSRARPERNQAPTSTRARDQL